MHVSNKSTDNVLMFFNIRMSSLLLHCVNCIMTCELSDSTFYNVFHIEQNKLLLSQNLTKVKWFEVTQVYLSIELSLFVTNSFKCKVNQSRRMIMKKRRMVMRRMKMMTVLMMTLMIIRMLQNPNLK